MLDLATRRFFAFSSIALRYPELDWLKSFPKIESQFNFFEETEENIIRELLSYFNSKSLLELQTDYVSVFDRKRRACLYLSYYLNGDTRKRGMALVHFKEVYATEGWSSTGEELDDFLPILLEFIAVTDSPLGLNILQEHRAGIKLLEIALRDMKSPYQRLVEAIFNKIPGKETLLTLKLIQEGPPIETVGLSPYGENRSDKKNVGMTC